MSVLMLSCNTNRIPVAGEGTPTALQNTDQHSAKAIPDFKMVDEQGNVVELSSFHGKKLFLNLWASWCPPCRREMPSIDKLYHSVDSSKVAFIMLSLDNSFDKAKKYSKSRKLDMPLYYPVEKLPAMLRVSGIPATFIFNEQGELVHRTDGSDNYFTAAYKKLLQ